MAALTYDASDSAGSSDSVLGQIGLPWPTVTATLSDVLPTTTIESGLTVEYPGFVRALASVSSLPVSIVDPWITLEAWDTPLSVVTAKNLVVVGSGPTGDDFYGPIMLSGLSGTRSFDIGAFSVQDSEPDPLAEHSCWLMSTSISTGTLRARLDSATKAAIAGGSLHVTLAAYYAQAIEEVEPAGIATDAWDVSVELVAGNEVRLYVSTQVVESGLVGLEWEFVPHVLIPEIVLSLVSSYVQQTPASLRFGLVAFWPNSEVVLEVPGTGTSASYMTDSAGFITNAEFVLPASMSAGTYKLRATLSDPLGLTGLMDLIDEVTFTVADDPTSRPTLPPADAAPTLISQPPGVRRWVLQDPMPGGLGSYVVPLNPNAMSNPELASNLSVDRNTAGGYHFWEGAGRARRWRFGGEVLSLTHLQKLIDYTDLRRRFYIIDHHNRAWKVTAEELRYTPAPKLGLAERHLYEVDCMVYGDEVQL